MKTARIMFLSVFLIGGVLATAGDTFAQGTGTILGTVEDSSGAVIPGVGITATHEQTGATRQVSTDNAGTFLIPRLAVGNYTVSVEHSGFRKYENHGIVLQVDQSVTLPVVLEVGQVTEVVTVEGAGSLLQTNTATLSQVVERQRIEDLPLNGRNVLQLISLNAGVSSRGVGTHRQFQISGGGFGSPNSVNGTRGNQTTFKLDGGNNTNGIINAANPFPNPDALQEFSIQTNNFSAEYGNVAGGIVNVVTKSGTNDFHGSIYEFYRDGRLNARNFFAARHDDLKRHQFGAALGGPLVRNRLFFFGAYQGTRIREVVSSRRVAVLTAAQEMGDLSSISTPIIDPLTGEPFPNNVIPADRFDPVSRGFLDVMPAANVAGTNLFAFDAPKDRRDNGQWLGKIDHQLTESDQVSARIFYMPIARDPAWDPTNAYSHRSGEGAVAKNATFNHTHIFSPRLLNVARYTYNFQRTDTSSLADIGPVDFGSRMIAGIPNHFRVRITGLTAYSPGFVGRAFNKSYEFADTVSFSTGSHNWRFGYQYLRDLKFATNNFAGSGLFTFSGQRSGHAIADFLLGLPVSLGMRNVATSDTFANYHGLFVQDDYRITSSLTLNLGLRWDGTESYLDRRGFQPYFRAGQQSTVFPNAPLGALFPGDPGTPTPDRTLNARPANPDRNNLAPRFGFAWNPSPKWVVRGAYGVFYTHAPAQITAVAAEPWVASTNINNPETFSNPFGDGEPVDPNTNEAPADFIFSPAPSFSVMDPNFETGLIQTMNFGFERELTSALMVRAMYVGTIGQQLEVGRDINSAIYIPGQSTSGNINARRPFQGIGPIRNTESTGGSWYHSMQLSATQRFTKGLGYQINYTLSKSIDETSIMINPSQTIGPDPNNRRLNRGLSDFDATHTLVASGIWELPGLDSTSPVARQLVNGWQINAIVLVQSGNPFTPFDSRDLAVAGSGGGVRLIAEGDSSLSTSRPRGQQILEYFNTGVFSLPPPGSFGFTGRGILRGPGTANVDFSVFKTFLIGELARLQFRSEYFNLFNRPNFNNPEARFNSRNFGRILSARAGRVLQFGLRLTF